MYPNLEAELKRRGIKRADIAACLGCAITTVSEKMQGNSDFSLGAAMKIKKLLGGKLSIEYLFETNDEPQTV